MLLFSVSLQYFHADVFISHELLTRKKPENVAIQAPRREKGCFVTIPLLWQETPV